MKRDVKKILGYLSAVLLIGAASSAYAQDAVIECTNHILELKAAYAEKKAECDRLKVAGGSKSSAYIACKSNLTVRKAEINSSKEQCRNKKNECREKNGTVKSTNRTYQKEKRDSEKIASRIVKEEAELVTKTESEVRKRDAKIEGYERKKDFIESKRNWAVGQQAIVCGLAIAGGNPEVCARIIDTIANYDEDLRKVNLQRDQYRDKQNASIASYQAKQSDYIARLHRDLAIQQGKEASSLGALDNALNANSTARCPAVTL